MLQSMVSIEQHLASECCHHVKYVVMEHVNIGTSLRNMHWYLVDFFEHNMKSIALN